MDPSVCVCVERFSTALVGFTPLAVPKRLRREGWVDQFRIVIHTVIISSMVQDLHDIDLRFTNNLLLQLHSFY